MKFKVGDRVRVIDTSFMARPWYNQVGIITDVSDSWSTHEYELDICNQLVFYDEDLEAELTLDNLNLTDYERNLLKTLNNEI